MGLLELRGDFQFLIDNEANRKQPFLLFEYVIWQGTTLSPSSSSSICHLAAFFNVVFTKCATVASSPGRRRWVASEGLTTRLHLLAWLSSAVLQRLVRLNPEVFLVCSRNIVTFPLEGGEIQNGCFCCSLFSQSFIHK